MNKRNQSRAERRRVARSGMKPKSKNNIWLWAIPALAVVVVVVVVVTLLLTKGPNLAARDGQVVPATVMHSLTNVPAGVVNGVGTNAITPPDYVATTTPPPTSSKPVVTYIGSEFCPFCGAERWPLIIALSRFGTFQGLKLTTSASNIELPNTPSFTFHSATYTSSYVDLQAVELQSNKVDSTTGNYGILATPTADQKALLTKYDAPPYVSQQNTGAIPFMMIDNTYLWIGASYDPSLLKGKTWEEISSGLSDSLNNLTEKIVANANEITAAICAVNGGKPADVCTSAGVQAAAKVLPTSASPAPTGTPAPTSSATPGISPTPAGTPTAAVTPTPTALPTPTATP